jgi:arsenate reductase-like glutaredoxin family protein
MRLDDAEIVVRLLHDPRLLRQPLVRHGNEMTVGRAEEAWAVWLKPPGASAAAR